MGDVAGDGLTCTAKLVRVVLRNRGPLSPGEVAEEARITTTEAAHALEELASADVVESVCGVPETREEVYALCESDAR